MIQQISRFKLKVKNFHGFTLIELIVSFSILSILSVVGVASFVNYSRSQVISSDRQKIITVLNTAKADASSQLKGKYDCQGTSQVLNGYSVSIDTDQKTYYLKQECITTVAPIVSSSILLNTYELSNKILFDLTNPNYVAKIFFPLFTGGAIFTNSSNSLLISPVTINLNGYNKTKSTTIIIDQTGLIK